jgi:hypothetical protein
MRAVGIDKRIVGIEYLRPVIGHITVGYPIVSVICP